MSLTLRENGTVGFELSVDGKKKSVLEELRREMQEASAARLFERAARLRPATLIT